MHKIAQEAPKTCLRANKCEKSAQSAPKTEGTKKCNGLREACSEGQSPTTEGRERVFRSTLSNHARGGDPRALRPLRGDRRIPFGFRHVPLEADSVESSGV